MTIKSTLVKPVALAVLLVVAGKEVHAEITLDGSLGPAGPLIPAGVGGAEYQILQDYGRTVGSNLFHSFGSFNVAFGLAATFYGTPDIGNIFARVTGGAPSSIDGFLNSAITGANLWLINPSGVLFGPHASVNVTGSFYVSTADYLKFADGVAFDAHFAEAPVLTAAAPEAFGFLGNDPALIAFQGSGSPEAEYYLGAQMAVPDGKSFSVVAGDIGLLQGSFLGVLDTGTKIQVPNGRINLVSVGSPGEVVFKEGGVEVGSNRVMGNILIDSGSIVSADGQGGEGIFIRGGNIVIGGNSLISAQTGDFASGQGGDISVIGNNLAISDGSAIKVSSASFLFGNAYSGNITINVTDNLIIKDGILSSPSGIFNNALLGGNAGRIMIKAENMLLENGAYLGGENSLAGHGTDIDVITTNLMLRDNPIDPNGTAQINTIWLASSDILSTGVPGNIRIDADSIELTGSGSGITTANLSGDQDAGDVTIHANTLTLSDGAGIESSTSGSARASDLFFTVDGINISSGAAISVSSYGEGDAGLIKITAPDIKIQQYGQIWTSTSGSGQGGNIDIETSRLEMQNGIIQTQTSSEGAGGSIDIHADDFVHVSGTLTNPSMISATTSGLGSVTENHGPAGIISINTPNLIMDGDAVIDARTIGNGSAGDVKIDIDRLKLTNGAQIGSTSGIDSIDENGTVIYRRIGKGDGGTVSINASESIFISGYSQPGLESGIYSQTGGSGHGGTLDVTTPSLTVIDGGAIGTDTGGDGTAGNINLTVNRLITNGKATISSNSGFLLGEEFFIGNGSGGNINITASGQVALQNDSKISVKSEGLGKAGAIVINAGEQLVSEGSSITAEASQSDGGNITVNARNLVHLTDSAITTSVGSGQGKGGNILIDPTFVILDNSRIVANAFGGPGGNIQIIADHFIASPDSLVDASSQFGVDGQVVITSPDTNMLGKIAALATHFLDPAGLFKTQCVARYLAGQSSLAVRLDSRFEPAPGDGFFSASLRPEQRPTLATGAAASCAK